MIYDFIHIMNKIGTTHVKSVNKGQDLYFKIQPLLLDVPTRWGHDGCYHRSTRDCKDKTVLRLNINIFIHIGVKNTNSTTSERSYINDLRTQDQDGCLLN